MSQLTILDVGANDIGAAGMESFAAALMKGALPELERLYFGDEVNDNDMGDAGLKSLAEACSQHGVLTKLIELSLWNNKISDDAWHCIVLSTSKNAFSHPCNP